MTYLCEECALAFDKPDRIIERDYIDTGVGLSWCEVPIGDCCPECGSEEIVELTEETEQ